MAYFAFDSATVEPAQSFDNTPLPAGTYNAQVVESDIKPLKSGNGTGMALTFEILDGQFARRKVWANLNVQHNNPVAQNIGQQQLSSLLRSVGIGKMQDTSQLHMKPLKIRLKIRKDDQYGDKNEVAGYEPMSGAGSMALKAPAPTAPAANTAPTAAPTAPWAAKAA